jgi:hypothetical protein
VEKEIELNGVENLGRYGVNKELSCHLLNIQEDHENELSTVISRGSGVLALNLSRVCLRRGYNGSKNRYKSENGWL